MERRSNRTLRRVSALLAAASSLALPGQEPPPPAADTAPDYVADIQPILARACIECHGAEKRRNGLRVDRRDALLAGGRHGPAMAPGDSAGSLLIQKVAGLAEGKPMPPKGERLSDREVGLLRAWIDAGAAMPEELRADGDAVHWSYRPIDRPLVPELEPGGTRWGRNDLDRFVLAELERRGLSPSPEAGGLQLLRRVSLDLTGLPPTEKDVLAFGLGEDFGSGILDRGPDPYGRAVDRLLASPRFGERWARMWLDLARYADTKGFEKDARRSIWRYRDWVIDAFNSDMPFDQFTIEQLAGDLLPQPTTDQLVATAFHRNTMTNDEGGTDDEEFRVEAVVDRVNTTMQVWMGSTIGCAQCHDHKYDPITQREYYELFAFFNNTADADRPNDSPVIRAPTAEQREDAAQVQQELASLRERLLTAHPDAERSWRAKMRERLAGVRRMALKADPWHSLGPLEEASFDAAFQRAFAPEQGVELEGEQEGHRWQAMPKWADDKVHNWTGDNSARYLFRVVRAANRGDVTLSLGSDDAIKVWCNGREVFARRVARGVAADQNRVVVTLREGRNELLLKIVNGGGPSGFYFRMWALDLSDAVRTALAVEPEALTDEQDRQLRDAWLASAPELRPWRHRIAVLEQQVEGLRGPTVPVLRELRGDQRRKTRVHVRGSFLTKGEEVAGPAVPACFPRLAEGMPPDRLALARWLVDRRNPLTARVLANRLWAEVFGTGLVETAEDFGSQGEPPSHPELLDWLACELMDGGWRIKPFLEMLVTSATYRQRSQLRPELLEVDPRNRWLARGPRFRLSAEAVRDQALFVSGLLSPKIGGPSVMPPQPDGVWQVVYSNDNWATSVGEDRYRRGLYTFWRRTSPHPAMLAFDAPSREFCVVRRIRTNTPIQALVTLNDPAFFEAAQALAEQMAEANFGAEPVRGVRYGFQSCLLRAPNGAELERFVELYRSEREHYRAHPEDALEVVRQGDGGEAPDDPAVVAELAAWTIVANVMLNLDEFLTKS